MSDPDAGEDGGGWPVALRGVTESVVTTRGPNDRWNVAALGLHAPDGGLAAGEATATGGPDDGAQASVTARTWGRTRTWRNFRERGEGYVQFTVDPVDFTEAALTVREEDDPVLDSADAWARVTAERIDAGESGGTRWVEWRLDPLETAVERETVATTNRGYYAVVEATVAASRLGVAAYDQDRLRERLAYFADVVETCGGDAERRAMALVREHSDWDG